MTVSDARAKDHYGITVVIPHFGSAAIAQGAVDGVLKQSTSMPVEVIVVDDHSPESFPERAGVQVVRRGKNGGFGAAVNTGAELANQPWLLILNSDVRLDPGFLDSFVGAAASVQPAICSPVMRDATGPVATANHFRSVAPSAMLAALRPLARFRDRGKLDWLIGYDKAAAPGTRAQTGWLTGACLLLPTDLFRAVHGFDTRFHMFCEEVDLQWRLRDVGVPAWLIGDLQVTHLGGASTIPGTRSQALVRSHYVMARKHGFAKRLLGTAVMVNCVNFIYDAARQTFGKDVHCWRSFMHHHRLISVGWRDSKVAIRRAGRNEVSP